MKLKIKLAAIAVVALAGVNVALGLTDKQNDDLSLEAVEAVAQNEGAIVPTFEMRYNPDTDCKVCRTGKDNCAVSDQCCKSWGGCDTSIL